jgi:hypothetical protein
MVKVQIDYDLSGYSYDPENPTREAEKLCYKLNTILDNLKSEGAELRMIEAQDITDSETVIHDLFESYKTPPEDPPEVVTPENDDMLMDAGIYKAINILRAAWLRASADKVAETSSEDYLKQINETLKLQLAQETTLYLSDGTPIFGKTGAIA